MLTLISLSGREQCHQHCCWHPSRFLSAQSKQLLWPPAQRPKREAQCFSRTCSENYWHGKLLPWWSLPIRKLMTWGFLLEINHHLLTSSPYKIIFMACVRYNESQYYKRLCGYYPVCWGSFWWAHSYPSPTRRTAALNFVFIIPFPSFWRCYCIYLDAIWIFCMFFHFVKIDPYSILPFGTCSFNSL